MGSRTDRLLEPAYCVSGTGSWFCVGGQHLNGRLYVHIEILALLEKLC